MNMKVKPIPEGYHSLTPHLIVKGVPEAIEFYKKAFGATEKGRFDGPNGKCCHAELQIGDSRLMMCEENAQWGDLSPLSAKTMNSCEAEPPILPESASTTRKANPQRLNIRL